MAIERAQPELRTLDELDVDGRRVLVRADLNVPLTKEADGAAVHVADDSRIRASLETIEVLLSRGAAVVLVSHLGRPKDRDPALSMAPVAARLRELVSAPVELAPGVIGPEVLAAAQRLRPGSILLLENVRFEPGETTNDPTFARSLADLADVYVDDAFGSAHRAHASTEGVAHLLPSAAGRLLQREVQALSAVLTDPARPLVAVLGGAKVGDKLGVLTRFVQFADVVCIGGAMAFPFLAAQGHAVGASLCDPEDIESAHRLLTAPSNAALELPSDLVVAESSSQDAAATVVDGVELADAQIGLDIGPRTAARYGARIGHARTVLWNGPMGRFERPRFASGTATVARAVSNTTAATVVGGGETVQALRAFGMPLRVTHISTGGGAMLDMLEGKALPGVLALYQEAVA